MHLHHGEEILRILSGQVDVTVGSERRRCSAGDVVIIPTDTPHGFTTLTQTTMEVVAELDAGQIFPVSSLHASVAVRREISAQHAPARLSRLASALVPTVLPRLAQPHGARLPVARPPADGLPAALRGAASAPAVRLPQHALAARPPGGRLLR